MQKLARESLMKVGDMVYHLCDPSDSTTLPVGLIVAVGFGKEFTDVDQTPDLHPDIWVLTNGLIERWNKKYSRLY